MILPLEGLRDLRNSTDPASWISAYWTLLDPDAETPASELRDVLIQRAEYLVGRFPRTSLGDIEEPWRTFLVRGPWASVWAYPSGRRGRQERAFRLEYEIPDPGLTEVGGIRDTRPLDNPDLTGAWACVEDPDQPPPVRLDALRSILWYETSKTADRLLVQPLDVYRGLQPEWDRLILSFASRIAYAGGDSRPARIATLTAVGEPDRFILERASAEEYGREEFLKDLRSSHSRTAKLIGLGLPEAHPRIWDDPEALIEELAERFPMPENLTGWDWRGDLFLRYGPPAFIDLAWQTPTYLYPIPMVLRVTQYSPGRVRTLDVRNPLDEFRDEIWHPEEVGPMEEEVQRAVSMLGGSSGARVTPRLLMAVRQMIRKRTFSVQITEGGETFPLYANAAVFPRTGASADVALILGASSRDASAVTDEGILRTDLHTSCILLDDQLRGRQRFRHTGGYVLQPTSMDGGRPYLVDTFLVRAPPGRHLYYLSGLNPVTGRSSGYMIEVRVPKLPSSGPVLSSLLMAADISELSISGGIRRAGSRIVPYPGNNLYYEEPLWLYYEIQGLRVSDVGDRRWEESYYIVPDAEGTGVIRLQALSSQSTIRDRVDRFFHLDLAGLETDYEGPVFLLVAVKDLNSGRSGITAAHLDLARR